MIVVMNVAYIVAIVVISILLLLPLLLIFSLDTPKIETWDESTDNARKRLNELKELKEESEE